MFFTFNKIIALTGVLATLVSASPSPEPPTESQLEAFESGIESLYQAVQTDPALWSLASSLENDPAALSSLQDGMSSLQDEMQNAIFNSQAIPSTFIEAFPTVVRPFLSSIINEEISIATANGIPARITLAGNSAAQPTNTAAKTTNTAATSTNAAGPTGNAMLGVSAGAVAGFIGAVALL